MGLKILVRAFIIFFPIFLWIAHPLYLHSLKKEQNPLSQKIISLEDRYANTYVNDIFKKNILLTLAYMSNQIHHKSEINWQELTKNNNYEMILNSGEIFAFHDDILDIYKNKQLKTTNAHFSASEGYLSSGSLYGDGVCHLASLIMWASSEANLFTFAPVKHDFAAIPDIPKEYGVSIYSSPDQKGVNYMQNLYIINTHDYPVIFRFEYKNNNLNLAITKAEQISL